MATQIATFGAGCFWCIEAAFNSVEGVNSAVSGYSGGQTLDPDYKSICTGSTGHAEVVQISFDDEKLSYEALLLMLFSLHDPTQLNRQGNDVGTQYRSVIYYHSAEQQQQANAMIADLTDNAIYDEPIVTEVQAAETFYPAEDYHQAYFNDNPNQTYCALVVGPKLAKFKQKYAEQLK